LADLLPPNATAYERAVDAVGARIDDVPVPLQTILNPATCAAELLPWLAWSLSIDRWNADWTEEQKRFEVARAIDLQRKKGTPASVEAVLASFDELLTITEWFEQQPPGPIHSFVIDLPLDDQGGPRATAAFTAAVVRDVIRIKPLRSHFEMRQSLATFARIYLVGAARAAGETRLRGDLTDITGGTAWEDLLQDENGEPLQEDSGAFIENDT